MQNLFLFTFLYFNIRLNCYNSVLSMRNRIKQDISIICLSKKRTLLILSSANADYFLQNIIFIIFFRPRAAVFYLPILSSFLFRIFVTCCVFISPFYRRFFSVFSLLVTLQGYLHIFTFFPRVFLKSPELIQY